MKQLVMLLGLALTMVIVGCKNDAQESVKVVTPDEIQTILGSEGVQLVDVRTPEEFQEGYIENAQNIDYYSPTFENDIQKLDKSKPVILYCKSGNRSAKCAQKLLEAGFEKIYDLEGGITEWQYKGLDVIIE